MSLGSSRLESERTRRTTWWPLLTATTVTCGAFDPFAEPAPPLPAERDSMTRVAPPSTAQARVEYIRRLNDSLLLPRTP
ncbi:MAG: hypothetical protein DMD35_02105 [Gemmatimonadetes bacterium]|nr:MAG: hypothetical protein DMD35_02105 [Gemmatimonadota bacterium]